MSEVLEAAIAYWHFTSLTETVSPRVVIVEVATVVFWTAEEFDLTPLQDLGSIGEGGGVEGRLVASGHHS